MKRLQAKLFTLLFVTASLLFALPASVTAQLPQSAAQAARMKSKIEKIGERGDLTVRLQNGKTYHGFVAKIGDLDFEIAEVDLRLNLTITYAEVKSVESGYGEKGPLGNRVGKKGRRFGRIVMIGLAALVTVVVVVGLREKTN